MSYRARRLAAIASRRDRFLIPKDMWDERDWRQHRLESRKRGVVYKPSGEVFPVFPRHSLAPGFGGLHGAPRDKASRVDEVLRKYR